MQLKDLTVFTIITIVLILGSLAANGATRQIKVAVIDTGFGFDRKLINEYKKVKLCKTGHKTFVGKTIADTHGHGTNITGLIDKFALGANYCQIIIKYWDKNSNTNNLSAMINAINHAISLNVDIINISGGGYVASFNEHRAILRALNSGIVVVAAAGNEGFNMASRPFYPAMYDKRVTVIGYKKGNYGKGVDIVENGFNQTALGLTMTGSSQATAIFTGKLISFISNRRDTL